MKTKTTLLTFITFIVLCSCRDDPQPKLNKTVVDKVIASFNGYYNKKYSYNADGTVKRIDDPSGYTDFTYLSGKLVSKKYYSKDLFTGSEPYSRDTFSYAANGQMTKAILLVGVRPDGLIYEFTWSDNRVSRFEYTVGVTHHLYELDYDERGNATTIRHYSRLASEQSGQESLDFIYECEYDDNINPLQESALPFEYMMTGPNNLISRTDRSPTNGEIQEHRVIEYNYNEDNLPLDKTEKIDPPFQDEFHYKFFYKRM